MALMQQQKEFWDENGYLVVESVLSQAELEPLRQGLERLTAQAQGLTESTDRFKLKAFESGGGNLVQQIAEPHELGAEWMALARDPRHLDVVEGLIGPNLMLYYSMLMMKPAREGFQAPWHQDFAFFVHDRANMLACQFYIDDSTQENGCIRVVPGSHKLGLINHFKGDQFTGIVQGDTSEFDKKAIAAPVPAGGMLFWHSMTLHSSQPNRSERPRRAIVFEYKDPGARLMGGAFNSALEVRTVGLMVRGRHPRGELLSAL